MIEAHGRVRAEWKGPKWQGGNTNGRLEVRVRSRGGGEGHMGSTSCTQVELERHSVERIPPPGWTNYLFCLKPVTCSISQISVHLQHTVIGHTHTKLKHHVN